MIEKYKHIIWDWNGTLLDDTNLCVELINEVLIKRNLPSLTLQQYRDIFTFPVKDYYAKTGLDFSKEPFEVVGKEWMDGYELRKKECGLSKFTREVLNGIAKLGVPQSILSAYSQSSLIKIIGDFGLSGYFSNLIGLDHIYATGKVELGRNFMTQLGLQKGEALLIGDTIHDFEVASAIGADCILIAGGHQDKERLLKTQVPVYDSMEQFYYNL
jgi:phosphoglycolate phosphatase